MKTIKLKTILNENSHPYDDIRFDLDKQLVKLPHELKRDEWFVGAVLDKFLTGKTTDPVLWKSVEWATMKNGIPIEILKKYIQLRNKNM